MGIGNRTLLFLGITLLLLSNNLIGQTNPSAPYLWNGEYVRDLEVEKGRTIYNITKTLSVSEADLFRLNPELKANGLKAGMIIKIPAKPDELNKELEEENTNPNTEGQKTPRLSGAIKHKVKKKESVFGIAKMYGVSVDDVYALNPEAKDGIKAGMELTIYPKPSVQPVEIIQKSTKDSIIEQPEVKVVSTCEELPLKEQKKKLNVSLLLPFYLPSGEEFNPRSRIGLDFYGGVKLALDSLKQEGYSVDIHVFDTQNDSSSVNAALNNPSLKAADLIIGPLYSAAFIRVAEETRSLNIPAITPFSQSEALISDYPNVIKVTPSTESQIEALVPALQKKFPGGKFILVNSELSKDMSLNAAFKDAWNSSDSLRRPALIEEKYSTFKTEFKSLDFVKQNIVVFLCTDEVKVIDITSKLERVKETYRIQLVGLNDWNSYDNLDYELLNALHFTYASSVYSDFSSGASLKFQSDYKAEFKGEPTFYSYQGFDIAYYFIKKLACHGNKLSTCLPRLSKECGFNSCYLFKRTRENDGFENSYINILKLDDFKAVRLSDYE